MKQINPTNANQHLSRIDVLIGARREKKMSVSPGGCYDAALEAVSCRFDPVTLDRFHFCTRFLSFYRKRINVKALFWRRWFDRTFSTRVWSVVYSLCIELCIDLCFTLWSRHDRAVIFLNNAHTHTCDKECERAHTYIQEHYIVHSVHFLLLFFFFSPWTETALFWATQLYVDGETGNIWKRKSDKNNSSLSTKTYIYRMRLLHHLYVIFLLW